jgi:hypothetical protein
VLCVIVRNYLFIVSIALIIAAGSAAPASGADIEADVVSDITTFGEARAIIFIDPSGMIPVALSDDEAVDRIVERLSEDVRHSLRQIGRVPIFAGALKKEGLAEFKEIDGVKIYLSRPVPPLVDGARIAVGLPLQEPYGGASPHSMGDTSRYAVAVLDNGFETSHSFIKDSILREACFSASRHSHHKVTSLCPNKFETQTTAGAASRCPEAAVRCGHGTHVAGLVSGKDGIIPGHTLSGIAAGTPLILINVFTQFDDPVDCFAFDRTTAPCVLSFVDHQLEALEYIRSLAREHRIAAVNLSLGRKVPNEAECQKDILASTIRNLLDIGILTTVAAGNDKENRLRAPACVDEAVAVSATNKSGELALNFPGSSDGSNMSGKLDIAAPGVGIWSSIPGGKFGSSSGTSMAAPVVAAAIARVRQILGPTTGVPVGTKAAADAVLSILKRNAKMLGAVRDGEQFTVQVLNLGVALADAGSASALSPEVSTPAGAGTIESATDTKGADIILNTNRALTSAEVENFTSWVRDFSGDAAAVVTQKPDRNRLILELAKPVDKTAVEAYSFGIGAGGKAFVRSLAPGS